MRAASTIRLLERERGIARARALSASMVCVICGAQTRCGVWCERVTWRREMRGKTERTEAGCGLGLYSDFLRAKVPEPRAGGGPSGAFPWSAHIQQQISTRTSCVQAERRGFRPRC